VCDSTNSACDIECASRPRDVFVVACNATDSQWHYHTNSSGFSNGNFTAEWTLTNTTSNDFCRAGGVGGNSDGIQGRGDDGEGGTAGEGMSAGVLAAILVPVFALLVGAAVGGYCVYSRQQHKNKKKRDEVHPSLSYDVNVDVELPGVNGDVELDDTPVTPKTSVFPSSAIAPVPSVLCASEHEFPLPQSRIPPLASSQATKLPPLVM
jgi:hypothetical protein